MNDVNSGAHAPSALETWELLSGETADPHAVLGPRAMGQEMVVRALRPGADAVLAEVADGRRFPLRQVHPGGVFSAAVPVPLQAYRLVVRRGTHQEVCEDGYRFPPALGDLDLRLLAEGYHRRLWEVLGAVRRTRLGGADVEGVSFAVWAPNARGVQVRGDFNGWDGRAHPLRRLSGSGVWEVFVPGVPDGSRYRFAVLGGDGRWREKADPMASATERPPANASVVHTTRYAWHDGQWLTDRARTDWTRSPLSVYEVHLGSWLRGDDGQWLTYEELAHRLADYVRGLGFTHVQLLPVTEHPFSGSWGYQVTSYYAPTARFGDPDGFRYLVDHLHGHGIGVLLDLVPAHFPRDAWALGRFDGTPLYEHPDPRRGEHPDWGTYIFDYGREQVRNFLVTCALHWLEEFHVDGLRVDAVSSMLYLDYSRGEGQWLPNVHGGRENLEAVRLLRELTETVRRQQPGALVIAEESTAWPGVTDRHGLGFDLKWNMGWMHDTLAFLGADAPARRRDLTLASSLSYAFDERFMLPLSHDEVVHGKGSLWQRMPGDDDAKAAGVRALLAYMWAYPGKKLLFMGGEFAQPTEWDAERSLPWELTMPGEDAGHRGVQHLVRRLNTLYRKLPALHTRDADPRGFSWLHNDPAAPDVLAFLRHGGDGSVLACVVNVSGTAVQDYRLALPSAGTWQVALDTDSVAFAGARPPHTTVEAEPRPHHGSAASARVDLAPCAVLWLLPPGSPHS